MKLIVGLGNPGSKYAITRHNAGRLLVENLASHIHLKLSKEHALHASVATQELNGETWVLAFPEIFMNVSGKAVRKLIFHYDLDPKKDLLIVVDEVALPFGKIRLRSRGSDGGHNGLKSIHDALQTPDYARLRLGIGQPDAAENQPSEMPLEAYVLESFGRKEQKLLPSLFDRGRQACQLWVERPIEDAMNVVNSYPAIS